MHHWETYHLCRSLQSLAKPASPRVQLLEVFISLLDQGSQPHLTNSVKRSLLKATKRQKSYGGCSYQEAKRSDPTSTTPAADLDEILCMDLRSRQHSRSHSPKSIIVSCCLCNLRFDDATLPSRQRLHGGMGLCPPDRTCCGDEDARQRASTPASRRQ